MFLLSENEYFFVFINRYSLDFCLISYGVGPLFFDNVKYIANILLKSSLLTPSLNFETMLKFLLFVYSSGSLLLLKLSRLSRNRSVLSPSLCRLFSNLIITWWTLMTDPNWFNSISKILSAVSRSSSFFATTHICSVPSRLLSIALHACFSSFCSRFSFITSTHMSMQPSESSLNSLGFLKVFLDLPLPLSLESVFPVAIASSVLFIILPGTRPLHCITWCTRVWSWVLWRLRRVGGFHLHSSPCPSWCYQSVWFHEFVSSSGWLFHY